MTHTPSGSLRALILPLLEALGALHWLPPLAMRLFFGFFWLETGWAKLHNLEGFAGRFENWGIPFPAFSAALSAGAEWIGGGLLMLGLLTRFSSAVLAFNMLVALFVVVGPALGSAVEFFEVDEPLYLLIFLALLVRGPGAVSLDAWIARRLGLPQPASGWL